MRSQVQQLTQSFIQHCRLGTSGCPKITEFVNCENTIFTNHIHPDSYFELRSKLKTYFFYCWLLNQINNMTVSPYKVQVFQLLLSQNLTLIMQTSAHAMAVGDNANLHHVKISLVKVKEERPQIVDHNVLKAFVQSTFEEYSGLKAALLSSDTVFK